MTPLESVVPGLHVFHQVHQCEVSGLCTDMEGLKVTVTKATEQQEVDLEKQGCRLAASFLDVASQLLNPEAPSQGNKKGHMNRSGAVAAGSTVVTSPGASGMTELPPAATAHTCVPSPTETTSHTH